MLPQRPHAGADLAVYRARATGWRGTRAEVARWPLGAGEKPLFNLGPQDRLAVRRQLFPGADVVTIYDLGKNAPMSVLKGQLPPAVGETSESYGVFSPDGDTFAAWDLTRFHVWDTASGDKLFESDFRGLISLRDPQGNLLRLDRR